MDRRLHNIYLPHISLTNWNSEAFLCWQKFRTTNVNKRMLCHVHILQMYVCVCVSVYVCVCVCVCMCAYMFVCVMMSGDQMVCYTELNCLKHVTVFMCDDDRTTWNLWQCLCVMMKGLPETCDCVCVMTGLPKTCNCVCVWWWQDYLKHVVVCVCDNDRTTWNLQLFVCLMMTGLPETCDCLCVWWWQDYLKPVTVCDDDSTTWNLWLCLCVMMTGQPETCDCVCVCVCVMITGLPKTCDCICVWLW